MKAVDGGGGGGGGSSGGVRGGGGGVSGSMKEVDGEEPKASNQAAIIVGQIHLGGLFPVHMKAEGTGEQCGQINEQRGIQVRRGLGVRTCACEYVRVCLRVRV